jgi:hypothetical protein
LRFAGTLTCRQCDLTAREVIHHVSHRFCFQLFAPQRCHRLHARRAPRRRNGRKQRREQYAADAERVKSGTRSAHAEQLAAKQAQHRYCRKGTRYAGNGSERDTLHKYPPCDIQRLCAERETYADLSRLTALQEGDHGVRAEGGKR